MTTGTLSALQLTDDTYTVEQSMIRNKYKAMDSAGNIVLRGKQKMLQMKEEFPFVTGDDQPAFTVKAQGIMDVAGSYTLTDDETGEPVIVLDNDFSMFQDTWRLRDPDTEALVATIESRGALVTLARNNLPFGGLIPHKYEITDADGNHAGRIDGQLSVRDRYEISVNRDADVPREAVVAAAMVIDAIQGN